MKQQILRLLKYFWGISIVVLTLTFAPDIAVAGMRLGGPFVWLSVVFIVLCLLAGGYITKIGWVALKGSFLPKNKHKTLHGEHKRK